MKKKLATGLGIAFVATFVACASGSAVRSMQSSATVPGAQGELSVSDGGNRNTSISIAVKHLANPKNLRSAAANYVVWSRPLSGGEPQNLGALLVDEDLNGKLQTITPFRQFALFITAEPAPNVLAPSGEPLLWTNVSRAAE